MNQMVGHTTHTNVNINDLVELTENGYVMEMSMQGIPNYVPDYVPNYELLVFWHKKIEENDLPKRINTENRLIEYHIMSTEINYTQFNLMKKNNKLPKWLTWDYYTKYIWLLFSVDSVDGDNVGSNSGSNSGSNRGTNDGVNKSWKPSWNSSFGNFKNKYQIEKTTRRNSFNYMF